MRFEPPQETEGRFAMLTVVNVVLAGMAVVVVYWAFRVLMSRRA
jgi:hypothetical protein